MIISLAKINFGGGGGTSAKIEPRTEQTIIANGTYPISPEEGYDAMEGVDVIVAVPQASLQDNQTVDLTKNGTYTVTPDQGYDALEKATVNVNTPTIGARKSAEYTANGSYAVNPDANDGGIAGADITVNVPEKKIQDIKVVNQDVNTSGLYVWQADEGYDGVKTLRANLTIPSAPASTVDVGGLEMGLGYSKFTSLPSVFDFSNVTSYRGMFYKCDKLTSLTADLTNSTDNTDMTQGCTALTDLTLTGSLNKTLFLDTCPLTEESMVNVLDAAYNTTNPTEKKNLVFKYRYVQDDDQNTILTKYNDCIANKGWKISGMNLTVPPSMYEDYVAIWEGGGSISGKTSPNSYLISISISPYLKASDTGWTEYRSFRFPSVTTDVEWLDTSNVTNMAQMFSGCNALSTLDLSNFNTSNVTNMAQMFFKCSGLTSLDLSNFNTSNVTDMNYMFSECTVLTSLDLSNFNTSNVTDMHGMFSGCTVLTTLDLSNFNTSNVTSMTFMFSGCSGLTSLDLSNFNTSNVTYMLGMFSGCTVLTTLDLSNFNTSNVTNMNSMFYGCRSLTTVKVTNCDDATIEKIKAELPSSSSWTLADGVLTKP